MVMSVHVVEKLPSITFESPALHTFLVLRSPSNYSNVHRLGTIHGMASADPADPCHPNPGEIQT